MSNKIPLDTKSGENGGSENLIFKWKAKIKYVWHRDRYNSIDDHQKTSLDNKYGDHGGFTFFFERLDLTRCGYLKCGEFFFVWWKNGMLSSRYFTRYVKDVFFLTYLVVTILGIVNEGREKIHR